MMFSDSNILLVKSTFYGVINVLWFIAWKYDFAAIPTTALKSGLVKFNWALVFAVPLYTFTCVLIGLFIRNAGNPCFRFIYNTMSVEIYILLSVRTFGTMRTPLIYILLSVRTFGTMRTPLRTPAYCSKDTAYYEFYYPKFDIFALFMYPPRVSDILFLLVALHPPPSYNRKHSLNLRFSEFWPSSFQMSHPRDPMRTWTS